MNQTPTKLHQEESNTCEHICHPKVYWKQQLRKKSKTQLLKKKPISKLNNSFKTKNVAKNTSKAIIQMIHNSESLQHLCTKDFLRFINRNKKIQNLNDLLKLIGENKNPKLNEYHVIFRKIWYQFILPSLYFLKNHFVSYIFNSKIKDPQWHIRERNNLIFSLVFSQNNNFQRHSCPRFYTKMISSNGNGHDDIIFLYILTLFRYIKIH
ncbi:hypothetical protein pb186bvf_012759 [Paramecium bursaria]